VPLIAALNSIALVAVVPLGLTLLGLRHLTRWWLTAGALAAIALWLPRGPVAVLLVLPYGLLVLRLLGSGLRRLSSRDLAVVTALVAPTVAGSALLAERGGYHLFGFSFTILALTVAHFHAVGFAAALIASLAAGVGGRGAGGGGRAAAIAAGCVPAGLVIILGGIFITPWLELLGTVVLTAGLWLISWSTLRTSVDDRVARVLFAIAAVVPLATMLLALDWALGRATGLPHLSITWMAATHGAANLLGFAICGLLAWRRLSTKDSYGIT